MGMSTLFAHSDETAVKLPDAASPITLPMQYFLQQLVHKRSITRAATEGTIKVSEVFGVIALIYEKIRGAIEYKREHLVRRNALERMLKRLLWERQGRNLETTAHLLLRELIWAHYLPNDHVAKSKITEVAAIIGKYIHLLNLLGGFSSVAETDRLWIIGVMSCEIEESLDIAFERELFVELMFAWFQQHFHWQMPTIPEEQRDVQLYLAVHRALPKSDEAIMRYHLLIHRFPAWERPSQEDVLKVAQVFSKLKSEIEYHLNHPISLPLYRFVRKHAPPFEILQDVVVATDNISGMIPNQEQLELKVREICQVKYTQIRDKVNRGIVRSIIYIFVTKVLLAAALELPYELFILGQIRLIPIGINVTLPPLMMALLGLTIKIPDERNTRRILDRIRNIVYQEYQTKPIPFMVGVAKTSTLLTSVFSVIYLLLFGITFGGISYILYRLHFNILSGGIFFIFLSLVMLFGFRVRSTANELMLTGNREGLFGYLINNLSLPFLNFGVLLSKGIAKLNILIVIMDFLIEAPLKTIIEVIEEWTTFMREKREEVVDIPPE